MEAKFLQGVHGFKWVDHDAMIGKPVQFIRVFDRSTNCKDNSGVLCLSLQSNRRSSARYKSYCLKVSSSLNNQGSELKASGFRTSLDESLVLKNKSADIEQLLDGRCIFLVGMMGCGKTTIGRTLSEALNYKFSDSDLLVEQKMGGMSIAEIFKQHGENFFREKETEAIKELSMMDHLVISTGGGVVTRPSNWKHMRSGISVWLDVPLECLVRRISADGTGSRPLVHSASGNPYSEALKRLSNLLEARGEAYAKANVRISFEYIASRLKCKTVDELTPTAIAIEVLKQLESFLKDDGFAI